MKVITIGRSLENDVPIDDPCASRHHLQIIQHDDGHFTLSDFGSTNGTYVNGQKISGEIFLNENDFVRIGNSTIPWRLYFETDKHDVTEINENSFPYYDDATITSSNSTMSVEKERHGFVTFWLWLMMVCSVIGLISAVGEFQDVYKGIDQTYSTLVDNPEVLNLDRNAVIDFKDSAHLHTNIIFLCSVLSAICSIVFIVLILKWKKIGFWCWAGTNLLFGVIILIMTNQLGKDFLALSTSMDFDTVIAEFVSIPISILVLMAILQIKKNGVSCWKLLENPGTNDNEKNKTWLWVIVGAFVLVGIVVIFMFRHQSDNKQINDRLYTDIHSVFISGNDVYAVGSTCTKTSETDIPTLWKNGVAREIGNMGNFNHATSVFVSGEDVFVTINESENNSQALLWKNGENQVLADGSGDAEVNCVYVNGDDVYVAGKKDGHPTLWKNGIPESLGENGSAKSVVVKGNDVYVAGCMGDFFSANQEAFLYVLRDNGEEVALNLEMSDANSIFITNDGDVYVAGVVNKHTAALWKNGDFMQLENTGMSSAHSVAVNRVGKIVVTGISQNPISHAEVWVNGERAQVDDIFGYQAMSVVTDGSSFYLGGCSKDGVWSVYKYDGNSAFNPDNLIRVSTKE